MNSITLFTEEVDDIEAGLNDMLGQLDDFTLQKNTIGLLFVPTDIELKELTTRLAEKLDFPIIGATGTAILSDKCGYQVNAFSLQILTADDCSFTAGITGSITENNFEQEVGGLCRRLQEQAGEPPKVAITYLSLLKNRMDERYLQTFSDALPDIPLFGGVAAEDFSCDNSRVFCGTEIRASGAIVLLVSGAVRPLLHCEYSVSQEIPLPGEAVCTEDTVRKVGDATLLDALREVGIRSDNSYVLEQFIGLPFRTQMPLDNNDSISVVRLLKTFNHQDGSGSFLGEVKNGSHFSVGLLERSNVKKTVENIFTTLLTEVEAAGDYHYSTLICTSCAAREIIMAGDVSDEGDAFLPLLPGTMSLNGMYSFGEICPAKGRSGKQYNAFHTTSFAILAM